MLPALLPSQLPRPHTPAPSLTVHPTHVYPRSTIRPEHPHEPSPVLGAVPCRAHASTGRLESGSGATTKQSYDGQHVCGVTYSWPRDWDPCGPGWVRVPGPPLALEMGPRWGCCVSCPAQAHAAASGGGSVSTRKQVGREAPGDPDSPARPVRCICTWVGGALGLQQLKWEKEAKASNTTDGHRLPRQRLSAGGHGAGGPLGSRSWPTQAPLCGQRGQAPRRPPRPSHPGNPEVHRHVEQHPLGAHPSCPHAADTPAGWAGGTSARSPSTHWKLAEEIKTTGRGGRKGTRHREFITDTVLSTQIQWSYKHAGQTGHQPPVVQTLGHSSCRWRRPRRPKHCAGRLRAEPLCTHDPAVRVEAEMQTAGRWQGHNKAHVP